MIVETVPESEEIFDVLVVVCPERVASEFARFETVPERDPSELLRLARFPEREAIFAIFCPTIPEKEFTVESTGPSVNANIET